MRPGVMGPCVRRDDSLIRAAITNLTDRPMYDYDVEYRRLRAAGLAGWAGGQRERNVARMAETLDRLEREAFPRTQVSRCKTAGSASIHGGIMSR